MSDQVPLIDPFSQLVLPANLKSKAGLHEGEFDRKQVKMLVYGESGSGKTRFASTWPRCAFIDLDMGMSSVKEKVFRFKVEVWEDLIEVITYLVHNETPFDTIVLDSLNELQALSLRHVVNDFGTIRRAYDSVASQSDYGKMLSDFDILVREVRSIPKNIIFIAQVAPRQYETDPVQPQFTGKQTARNIARMMDVIGYIEKMEGEPGINKKRRLVFDAANFVTKDRSGVLPQSVEDPTYSLLNSYWEKG